MRHPNAVHQIDARPESQKLSYVHWEKYFNNRFKDWKRTANGLQETSHYRKDLTFTVGDSCYSLDFLKKLNIAFEVIDRFHVDSNSRVLELGSGFGQVGRILHHLKPGLQYVAVDLPESLYFAAIFLNLTCPNAKIVWIEKPEALAAALAGPERADMILVPCIFADQLAATRADVDVFINTSSLGEMDNASSQFYLKIVQEHLNTKHAFLLNRLLNAYDRNIEPDRAHENGWYFSLDAKWRVANWELEPVFTRIPYAEMFHNRELLWIASRSPEKVSHAVPDELFKQAWYQGFTLRASVKHANQIVFDTGMESVLCHLCESARINPTEKNLDALIKYLSVIRKPFPFEEMPLLFSLYKNIASSKHFLQRRKLAVRFVFFLLAVLGLRRLGVTIVRRLPPSIKDVLYKMLYKETRSWLLWWQKRK
jgi:putative sugar O-methyltransferase